MGRYLIWWPRVREFDGRSCVVGTAIKSCAILKSRVILVLILLSSSDSHPSEESMSETLAVLSKLPFTYLAALHCTASRLSLSAFCHGHQTDAAYSKDGRTMVLYAFALTVSAFVLMFRSQKS